MSNVSEQDLNSIQTIIEQHKLRPGALLPILHKIQDCLGYIPQQAIPLMAVGLQQSRAEIRGVISFYHHFRTTAPGRHQLQICRAEACQARGARELEQHAQSKLGIEYHQTSADQAFSLDAAYCLGNCACGPSVRVGNDIIGRVDPERFDQLIDQLSAPHADPTQELN